MTESSVSAPEASETAPRERQSDSFPNSTGSYLMEIKVRPQRIRYLLARVSQCGGVNLAQLLAQMVIRIQSWQTQDVSRLSVAEGYI